MESKESTTSNMFSNPFVKQIKFSPLRKLQVVLMSLSIAMVRLILFLIVFLITWILGILFTIGMPGDLVTPLTPFRTFLFNILQLLGRLNLKILGVSFIVKGKRASAAEAPILVAGPHSSCCDICLWFATYPLPAALSKRENFNIPLFGTLVKAIQPVLVVRDDRSSTQEALGEIKTRVKNASKWPQLIVFPEGTRTNGQSLILFKVGAFLCGAPVQPMTIRYTNSWNTYNDTEYGSSALQVLWCTFCQFWNVVEVEYLPVYRPNKDEIADAKLYANNVRTVMAERLGIKCTEHTFEDRKLMKQSEKMGFPKQHINVELQSVCKKYKVTANQVKDWLTEFVTISLPGQDGLVSVSSYSKFLGLPITDALRDLFEIYDTTSKGNINFSQYVAGHALLRATATTDQTLEFSCQVFKEYVACPESESAIKLQDSDLAYFDMSLVAREIEMRRKKLSGNATLRDFFILRPEFAMLCIWYKLILKRNKELKDNIPSDSSLNNNYLYKRRNR